MLVMSDKQLGYIFYMCEVMLENNQEVPDANVSEDDLQMVQSIYDTLDKYFEGKDK